MKSGETVKLIHLLSVLLNSQQHSWRKPGAPRGLFLALRPLHPYRKLSGAVPNSHSQDVLDMEYARQGF